MNEKVKIKRQFKSYLFWKRFFDIVLSPGALVFFSPVFLAVFIMNRFGDNKGPLFYKQERIGWHDKPFKIYEFRSMVANADKILEDDPELYAKYVANNYKLEPEEDPRITRLGEWLRETSIDEIPQFINILRGEMSIIGPRPVVKKELTKYGDQVDKFLSVKPGAMGLWQSSGRSNIPYPERCDVELKCVDKASLAFGMKIMFKNIISIFKCDDVY